MCDLFPFYRCAVYCRLRASNVTASPFACIGFLQFPTTFMRVVLSLFHYQLAFYAPIAQEFWHSCITYNHFTTVVITLETLIRRKFFISICMPLRRFLLRAHSCAQRNALKTAAAIRCCRPTRLASVSYDTYSECLIDHFVEFLFHEFPQFR